VSNTFRNLGFYSENVSQFPVITLRPQMGVRVGSDHLHVDVHPIAGLLDASFEHIAHTKLSTDLRQILRSALVVGSRSARDHAKPADSRERRDDFILNTLREKRVLLVR